MNTTLSKRHRHTHWPRFREDESQFSPTEAFNTSVDMPTHSPNTPNGITHSRSENNVAFSASSYHLPASGPSTSAHKRANSNSRQGDVNQSLLSTPVRGRAPERAPTPITYVEDVREDRFLDYPQSPTKRPRSPMKKMFGENGWLGRSTSMKELPSDQYRKHGLKNWGGKLKQRVEDIVNFFHPLHFE